MRRFISFLMSAECLLRCRSRWVLVGMMPCLCLGIYWAVQSPTYHARTVIEVKDMCPHGFLTNSFNLPNPQDHALCPRCKPSGAK